MLESPADVSGEPGGHRSLRRPAEDGFFPAALTAVRLGIFGGTFDPPHVGHLLAASDAYEALELDRLLFIPAGTPVFKTDTVEASATQRLEMVTRTIGDDSRFAVDPIEVARNWLSYTVETLSVLAQRYPQAVRYLVIGEDLVAQIGSWREPERIAALSQIVVLVRSGLEPRLPGSDSPAAVPLRRIATRRIDVSSTEIRRRVRLGRSIHGFVTDAVAEYIHTAGLYR